MKEIVAIIRTNMMNRTRQTLIDKGFAAFTVRKVVGRGKGEVDFKALNAVSEGIPDALPHLSSDGPRLVAKRMINLIVEDGQVPKAVEAIITANKTGHPGDGRIFIRSIIDSVRIRTGESGDAALA
jgi:nitrogen regulatory protein PII 2